jgi:hypothetical protein
VDFLCHDARDFSHGEKKPTGLPGGVVALGTTISPQSFLDVRTIESNEVHMADDVF